MFDFESKLKSYPEKINKCISDEIQNSLSTIFLDMVSGICNHNCIFCDGKYNYLPNKMFTEERLFQMAEELKVLGVNSIIIVGEGGESTLHPSFEKFSKKLINMGFHVGLYTNGCTNLDYMLDVLSKFDFIRISMDSGSLDTHYRIHRGEKYDFNKMVKFAKSLKNCGAQNIGFSFIIMEENYLDVCNAIDIAENVGVDYIEFKPFYAEEYKLNLESKEIILNTLKSIKKYIEKKHIQDKVIFNNQFEELILEKTEIERLMRKPPRKCLTSKLRMVISPTGCYLCTCFRNNERYDMGDPNLESLISIWYGEKHKELLNRNCCYRCTYDSQNEMLLSIKKQGYLEVNEPLVEKQKYFL